MAATNARGINVGHVEHVLFVHTILMIRIAHMAKSDIGFLLENGFGFGIYTNMKLNTSQCCHFFENYPKFVHGFDRNISQKKILQT